MVWQVGVAAISVIVAWYWWQGRGSRREKLPEPIENNGDATKNTELQSKESFGEKDENKNCKSPNGIQNLAYTKDEETSLQMLHKKIVTSQPTKQQIQPVRQTQSLQPPGTKVFRDRQISDISAFFAVGNDDSDPDLTDMVMEELNKSMPILPMGDDIGVNDDTTSDVFTPVNDDDDSVHSDLIQDSNERIRETFEFAKNKDNVVNSEGEEQYPPPTEEPPTNIEERPQPQQRSTEWRDKLIENLMNDDVEFELSESETESESSIHSGDHEHNVVKPPPPQLKPEDKTKGSTQLSTDITSQPKRTFKSPIVIDNGSYEMKIGLAGEFTPSHTMRSIIGRWKTDCSEAWGKQYGELLIGEDAINRHAALSIQNPQKDGAVVNWKDMGYIWETSMSESMGSDAKEHPLLITEPTWSSKAQREKSIEVAIEKLYCPLVYLKSQAALSAFSTGADVAVVINSGHSYTEVVPVYYGYALQHACTMVPIGGVQITEFLARLIKKESGHSFQSFSEIEVLNKIKEQHSSFQSGKIPVIKSRKQSLSHELPDGQVIELKNELTRCTEALYQPDLIGCDANKGLTQLMQSSMKCVDSELVPEIYSSILLSGGNSRLRGFKDRIDEELLGLDMEFKTKSIVADQNSAWIGGSLFANQEDFNRYCISDDLYFEYGSSIVHRMCL